MSGMEPALIGAALGGGASAAMGKNPIQGALLGGLTGGVYGAASSAASNVAGQQLATDIASQPALGFAAGNLPAAQAMANPGLLNTLQQVPETLKTSAMQNPGLAMQGFGAAQSLLEPQQVPQAPMGQVHRGGQVAPVDFASALNPYQNTVIRPQPFSLLG